ncbi:Doubtful CDS. No database matches [Staphylococcus aureus]|nr:Doubtful CDS. No database matches [Staphylococcus aureus]
MAFLLLHNYTDFIGIKMKLFYIVFLIIIWLNIFLGNEIIHTLTVLITTLYIVNSRKGIKNDRVE